MGGSDNRGLGEEVCTFRAWYGAVLTLSTCELCKDEE